jgi:hypothetical protein
LYEVSERLQSLPQAPPDYAPTFLIPDMAKVQEGRTLLEVAQSHWNTNLLEDPSVFTTIQFAKVREALTPAEREKLVRNWTTVEGEPYPGLMLQSRQDLARLTNGITFQIRRRASENPYAPFNYVTDLPLSAFTDSVAVPGRVRQRTGTTFLESGAFPAWDDAQSTRIRLLGVLLEIIDNGGLPAGVPLKVYLRQEAQPNIWVRDTQHPGEQVKVSVPLAAMRSEGDLDLGVRLVAGAFVPRQWQTRPLFGTYTVRIGNSLRDFARPRNFKIQIHFVALGRP